jgi:hypothetical protein
MVCEHKFYGGILDPVEILGVGAAIYVLTYPSGDSVCKMFENQISRPWD